MSDTLRACVPETEPEPDTETENESEANTEAEAEFIDGILIARVVGFVGERVIVQLPDREEAQMVNLSCGVVLRDEDVGGEVALSFVGGDRQRPLLLGRIARPSRAGAATVHERELSFEADRQLSFRCGKSTLILRRDGRIELRGEELISEARGVNRVRGGRIDLN